MTDAIEPARVQYAPGEAWCIAAERVVLVCERDLTPARAAALHAAAAGVRSLEALRALVDDEPAALLALVDLAGSRALLRRHGVPATADEAALPDRFGADWSLDESAASASIAAGGLGALEGDVLPLEGGVVRVAAVRVAPGRADASPHRSRAGHEEHAVAEAEQQPSTGAFGQTLPPAAPPAAAASLAPEPPEEPALPGPAHDPTPALPAPADEPTPALPAPAPVLSAAVDDSVPALPAPPAGLDASEPARTDTGSPIGGLIDSVPGFIKPAADVHVPEPTAARAGSAEPATPGPAPAAAPHASAPSGAPGVPASSAALGDHDGMTVTAGRARELMAERQAAHERPEHVEPAPATGPVVLSTLCPAGHVNAPGTLECAWCGATVDERSAAQRRRPEVAVVVLPSGERVPLGRGVVIGRRPRSRRAEDGRVPRLVTVESPNEDISRSHVELRVEDWNLVAVDLSSTNGTLLLREGAAPQRLRPEASTILQLGDRLDLGDGVVVTLERVDGGRA